MMQGQVYIGLGSNQGDRCKALEQAMAYIEDHSEVNLVACSSFYESAPWGVLLQPDFLNAVTEVETSLTPQGLLAFLQECEQALGRDRTKEEHWGPRTIDLDILLFGQSIVQESNLTIPHPFMEKRRFVLEPLCELAPNLRHPFSNQPIAQLLKNLPEGQAVSRYVKEAIAL